MSMQKILSKRRNRLVQQLSLSSVAWPPIWPRIAAATTGRRLENAAGS
jgi:hypothetical protein